jgi:hypothetical protein
VTQLFFRFHKLAIFEILSCAIVTHLFFAIMLNHFLDIVSYFLNFVARYSDLIIFATMTRYFFYFCQSFLIFWYTYYSDLAIFMI